MADEDELLPEIPKQDKVKDFLEEQRRQKELVPFIFDEFTDFDAFIAQALKEGNYVAGYKKLFEWRGLDDETLAEGMDLIRQAVNIRAAIYRHKDERALARKNYADAVTAQDEDRKSKWIKEQMKVADKIVLAAFGLVRLRAPMDNFLVENDIDPRPRKKGI